MRARAWTRPAGEGVPLPEEEGFNKRPRGVTVKGFGQDVRWILLRMQVALVVDDHVTALAILSRLSLW